MKMTRKQNAFTLVEILIVVIILGILAAIVIPQFTSA
ncbi:MAG: prepilin-type N-terminal cleavage/methylation domain-containing protein, partial [Phycisphaerae bacterium]